VLGPRWLRPAIQNRCLAYAGATPLPPPFITATLASIRVLRRQGSNWRRKLRLNTEEIRHALTSGSAMNNPLVPGPVVAVVPTNAGQRRRLERRLWDSSILPPWCRYPGGPEDGYFRFALSAAHSAEEVRRLAGALRDR